MSKDFAGSALTLSLLLLVLSAGFSVHVVVAEPVERTAGVKVGDTVKYGDFLAFWYSDNPTATIQQDMIDANNTLWIANTVLNVSGTTVTFQQATRYKNGTEESGMAQIDVETGNGNGTLTFVSTNLEAGDTVYTAGQLSTARINSTISRAYLGVYREINLLNVTATSYDIETYTLWNELFWDKATGVLAEQLWSWVEMDEDGYVTMASVEYRMVDTTIWTDVSDDVPPVADAGPDQAVEVGASVSFDASGSRDNIGIAYFLWNFGDESTGTGMHTAHTYGSAGTYDVTLTVEDWKGNRAEDTLKVTVEAASSPQVPPSFIVLIVLAALLVMLWLLFKRR